MGSSQSTSRPPNGIVIGIDVGLTYSGVSFAFLPISDSERPKDVIRSVMSFSNAEKGKVPSVVWYSPDGEECRCGLETERGKLPEGWTACRRFKLHFRPESIDLPVLLSVDALPHFKTAEDVMGDFLGYLYRETVKYIKETSDFEDGEKVWNDVKDNITFVLSLPNRWEGLPQARLRRSAVKGGLVKTAHEAQERVKFVSEGEASALSCLDVSAVKAGYQFIVLDAGGGTLDVSSYNVTNSQPLNMVQTSPSMCIFAGSALVDDFAREMFEDRVKDTVLHDGETINVLVKNFQTVKEYFCEERSYAVKIDHLDDTNDTLEDRGILNGQMLLEFEEVKNCFEPSVLAAIDLVVKTCRELDRTDEKPMPVWLVGGFGSSKWILQELKRRLNSDPLNLNCQVFKPDRELNLSSNVHSFANTKLVAIGAVRYSLYKNVTERVIPYSYGVSADVNYNEDDAEHTQRQYLVRTLPGTSRKVIGPTFQCIARKNEKVSTFKQHHAKFFTVDVKRISEARFLVPLYGYDGPPQSTVWFEEKERQIFKVCDIKANLTEQCTPSEDVKHWTLQFSVELILGSTEIEARIKWEQNGSVKYSPAQVVYA